MKEVEQFAISGKKFRAERLRLVFTQEEFGAELGMGTSNVRRIERGLTTVVRPEYIRALAKLNAISPEEQLARLAPSPTEAVDPAAERLKLTAPLGPVEQIDFRAFSDQDLAALGRRVAIELLNRCPSYPDAKRQLTRTSDFLLSMNEGLRRRKHA